MSDEEILKQALNNAVKATEALSKQSDEKPIGQHSLYKKSVKMCNSIKNHAVKDLFPKDLFHHRSPNQTEKEATYIEKNYKQVTLPVFVDYINTITRPFGDGNWSINYREEKETFKNEDLDFKHYVEKGLPIYGSLENFIKFILPSIKTTDANGFISIRPQAIEYIEGDNEEYIIDPSKLFEPTIYFHESKNVIDYVPGEYYLFLSKEKSGVKTVGGIKEEGCIYELYTRNEIYFIIQQGVKSENMFRLETFMKHDLNEVPVHQLMGVPSIDDDKILWQSPFLYSVDLLDLVLINSNWLQASINSCVFPVKVMYGSPCEFKDTDGNSCDGGWIHSGTDRKQCSSCGGMGLKSRISPIGTLLLNPTTRFEVGEDKSVQDPLRFISPEVHTLEFIGKKIAEDEMKAKAILHIRNKNSSTKTANGVTATEVFDDAKGMTAFVKPISDQIFMLYEFCLEQIGKQRYGEEFEEPQLSYPKTFDFKSPEDYLQDITNAMTNNLPPSFIQTLLMQYISAFHGDSASTTKVFTLIANADRLFGLTQPEILLQLARGTVAKWEQVLHSSILMFIQDIERDEKDFLNKDLKTQIETLQNKAKEKEKEISESSDIYNLMLPTTATNNSNQQQQPMP